tara:strand:- start:952 stop:1110 length:159 start_codon:yes stop_codon:yes gene_type:complete
MKPTPREAKEAYKNYERVVKHLLDEGYAEDQTSADNIISGMSEEWYSLILSN